MGDDLLGKLPQGFREKFTQEILSRTTPADVARLSLVSKSFYSAANSDVVWDKFIVIPPDHREDVIYYATQCCRSSKEVFLFLCLLPFGENVDLRRSLWLDKWSGKMCLKIQKLAITQLETDYWKERLSLYRFPELGCVLWLEVYGKVPTSRLSPETTYEAYLVFGLSDYVVYGLHIPIEASVGIPGEKGTKEIIFLDPRIAKSKSDHHYPNTERKERDGFIEVKLGEYFNKEGEDRDVEITLKEVKSGRPKCGVYLAGVEMRPKRNINRSRHVTNHPRIQGQYSKSEPDRRTNCGYSSRLILVVYSPGERSSSLLQEIRFLSRPFTMYYPSFIPD